uniref:Uncharacterized protein n=1 Tax=Anas platyrhynchos platyrhynchos TaxID=8840 RepID=A0A493TAV9_ANAPP
MHITPEKFYVEACDDGADDVLAIDRVSTEVTLTVKKDVPPSAVTRPIYGILGTIRLVAGKDSFVLSNAFHVVLMQGRAVADMKRLVCCKIVAP